MCVCVCVFAFSLACRLDPVPRGSGSLGDSVGEGAAHVPERMRERETGDCDGRLPRVRAERWMGREKYRLRATRYRMCSVPAPGGTLHAATVAQVLARPRLAIA